MTEKTKSARGRPPGAKGGKGANLATRITLETRAALEAEAERSGRSISQTAELWLEMARLGETEYLRRVGSVSAAKAIEVLSAISRKVSAAHGDPGENWFARTILFVAWRNAIPSALPGSPSVELERWRASGLAVSEASKAVLESMGRLPPEDPIRVALEKAPTSLSDLVSRSLEHQRRDPIGVLTKSATAGWHQNVDNVVDTIRLLSDLGSGLKEQLKALTSELEIYVDAKDIFAARAREAEAIGEALAKESKAGRQEADWIGADL